MASGKEIEVRKQNRSPSALDLSPELDRMFENMVERFFGRRFSSLVGDWPELRQRSRSEIQETDNAYILSAEIPGVPRENIEINVTGNLLTVRAEHREESGREGSNEGYRRHFRSFNQSFTLPTTVDPDKIEAQYEDGMLEVLLPKTEKSIGKRVEVQTGKGGLFKRLTGKDEKSESKKQDEAKH